MSTVRLPRAWPHQGILAVLALAPLPLGSNRPLAWNLMALVVAVCLAGWGWDALRNRRLLVWGRCLTIPAVLLALVLVWIVASLVPGVPWADPVWAEARVALDRQVLAAGSIDPDAGLDNLVRLSSYVATFWLTLQYGRKPDRALDVLRVIGLSGAAYALMGLIVSADARYALPWLRDIAIPHQVSGPFVNRNHFATFAGMACFANLGLALAAFRQRWSNTGYLTSKTVRSLSSITNRSALYLLCAAVCLMALLQSQSRMGFIAFVAALGAGTLLLVMTGMFSSGRRAATVVTLALLAVFYVSGSATSDRLAATSSVDRGPIYEMSLAALAQRPWTGFGYGAFTPALQRVRDGAFLPGYDITEAHNVYLQLAVELGIPGAAALVMASACLMVCCVLGAFRRQRDRIFPVVAVAAGTMVAVHSLGDFSVQVPAVALTFAALMGVGVAQSWSNRSYFEASQSLRKAQFA